MRIAITGAGGQLGSEFVHILKNSEYDIYPFSSKGLDITNSSAISNELNRIKPELVINCAAYTDVDRAETDQAKAFDINENGARNLANYCKISGTTLIHFSTDYVFSGEEKDKKRFENGYLEDSENDPVNAYGSSKLAGEIAVQQSGCEALIIRVAWLCGRFGNNFVKKMLSLSEERDVLDVVDDQIGAPSFCFDVVEKTLELIALKEKGIFHICSKGRVSWYEFAAKIFELSDIEIQLNRVSSEHFNSAVKRPAFSLLSTQKIEGIGLKPIPFEKGLQKFLNQLNEEK